MVSKAYQWKPGQSMCTTYKDSKNSWKYQCFQAVSLIIFKCQVVQFCVLSSEDSIFTNIIVDMIDEVVHALSTFLWVLPPDKVGLVDSQ